MANWNRTEVTRAVRVEYVVDCIHDYESGPAADWNQVAQALHVAIREYNELSGAEGEPYDDAIQVSPRDDTIVIWFDKPEKDR